ncbi:MAG: hypothetical protein IJ761_04745 [Bacteroidales bacterium]|nr:hypothetical protein [Bacteroidales bacterium]
MADDGRWFCLPLYNGFVTSFLESEYRRRCQWYGTSVDASDDGNPEFAAAFVWHLLPVTDMP